MAEAGYSSLRYEVADAIATITLEPARGAERARRDAQARAAGGDPCRRRATGPCASSSSPGSGAAFCAGQDLREASGPDAPPLSTVLRETYNPLILAMRRLDKPIVGAVNGVAAGAGLALALACDLRIAADTRHFVLAFGRVGLVPDSGTTWFLPRLVGPARAAELALIGDPLTAADAERWGLVNRVVPADALADEARAIAARLAAGAPLALGADQARAEPVAGRGPRGAARGRGRAPGDRRRGPRTIARASPRSSRSGRRGSPGSSGHAGPVRR